MNEPAYQLVEPHLAPVSPLRPRAGPHPAFEDEDDEGSGRASSSSSIRTVCERELVGRLASKLHMTGAAYVVYEYGPDLVEGALEHFLDLRRRGVIHIRTTAAAYFMGMLRRAAENRGRTDLVAPGESPEVVAPEHPFDWGCHCERCVAALPEMVRRRDAVEAAGRRHRQVPALIDAGHKAVPNALAARPISVQPGQSIGSK